MNDGRMGSEDDRFRARLAEGGTVAASLVGLDPEGAVSRARERGFDPEVMPHLGARITLDLRCNRIRLFLDETGKVSLATAG